MIECNNNFWQITIGEIINAIILFTTAVIVWKYTRAAQKSNEIQERPTLNLYLQEKKDGPNISRIIRIRNVGNGSAYNIKFFGIPADGYVYYPYFDEPNPILERGGDEKTVHFWVETPRGGVEAYDNILDFERFLFRLFKREDIKRDRYDKLARSAGVFLITYEDINGQKYYSVFRIYSKIAPLMDVYDLVVEFITNGKGEISLSKAKEICTKRPIMEKTSNKNNQNV